MWVNGVGRDQFFVVYRSGVVAETVVPWHRALARICIGRRTSTIYEHRPLRELEHDVIDQVGNHIVDLRLTNLHSRWMRVRIATPEFFFKRFFHIAGNA